jgi:type IV pilus assembly protein PilN
MWSGVAEVSAVILINLLPHRDAARKRKRELFFISLGIAALVGGLICGAVYSWYQAQIAGQKDKNTLLKTEISKLEGQIKDISGLQQEIAALRARQTAVEDLQGNRNMPVYLLAELVKQLPDGVYITSMKQDNQLVLITGVAQSNERVSELLRNLANNSAWLTKPELVEITAATIALSARDQRRVSNFSMRVSLKRASDQAKLAASAAQRLKPAIPAGVTVVVPGAVVPAPAVRSPVQASSAAAKV